MNGGKYVVSEEELAEKKKELAAREAEMTRREAQIKKDFAALQQWKDVLKGLSSPKISEEERTECLRVIQKAITTSMEERAAEEAKTEKESSVPPTQKDETK